MTNTTCPADQAIKTLRSLCGNRMICMKWNSQPMTRKAAETYLKTLTGEVTFRDNGHVLFIGQ